jgi:esterase/lipase
MVQDGGDQVEEKVKKEDKKTYRYIILHGYTGRPEKERLPHLKAQLELQGHEVHVPALPFPDSLALEDKVDMILKHATLDERTILVGYNL